MALRIFPSLSALPRPHPLPLSLTFRAPSPPRGTRTFASAGTPAVDTHAEVPPTPLAHGHETESYAAFTTRYVSFFGQVQDIFELQRGLNNCFAYDLVPAPSVIEAALRAARRVDDYATAVRVFEGVKEKVENKRQYQEYLDELKGVREELGITTKEELYEQ